MKIEKIEYESLFYSNKLRKLYGYEICSIAGQAVKTSLTDYNEKIVVIALKKKNKKNAYIFLTDNGAYLVFGSFKDTEIAIEKVVECLE